MDGEDEFDFNWGSGCFLAKWVDEMIGGDEYSGQNIEPAAVTMPI